MDTSAAHEIYQRAMDDMFAEINDVEIVLLNDILVHGPTIEIHDQRLKRMLTRCKETNLKLNPRKQSFVLNKLHTVRHKLTKTW